VGRVPPTFAKGRGDYLFYVSIAVLAATVFEILDPFELPFESLGAGLFLSGSLTSAGFVTMLLAATGYIGIFILMALESASLPIPSEVVLPFAGYMAFTGGLSFAGVVAVATAAGLVGALADYYLALKLGRPLVEKMFKWLGTSPTTLAKADSWISGRGSWIVLVARFVPGLRSAISLPAGALRMRLPTFASMTSIGAFGWAALLVYAGYSAGSLWQSGLARFSPLVLNCVMVAGAVVSSSYIVYHLISKAKTLSH